MANEDLIMKLSMYQQEAQKIEEQINMANQQIVEMRNMQDSLEEIDQGKANEILAPVGRGIFMKSKIEERKFFVSIGGGVVLKKDCLGAKELIEKQILNLGEIKDKLLEELGKINNELNNLILDAQKQAGENNDEHGCGCKNNGECNCEADEECKGEECLHKH